MNASKWTFLTYCFCVSSSLSPFIPFPLSSLHLESILLEMKDLLFVLPGFPRHASLTLESISYSPDFKGYLKNFCLTSNINLIEFFFCLRCFGFSPIPPPHPYISSRRSFVQKCESWNQGMNLLSTPQLNFSVQYDDDK